jgi:mercuric ion transport protein
MLAVLAVIACVGCCALPVLVPLGVLTTAGVAAATTGLLVLSAVLLALAGLLWITHHQVRRRVTSAQAGCGGENCSC